MSDAQVKSKKAKKPSRTPEQIEQERRGRFLKVAPLRVNKALSALANVARTGNKAGYSWKREEADKLIGALADALVEIKDAFADSKTSKVGFTF